MTQWNVLEVNKKGNVKKGQLVTHKECLRDLDKLLTIFGRIELELDDDKNVQIVIRNQKKDVFLGFPDPCATTVVKFLRTLHNQISMRTK